MYGLIYDCYKRCIGDNLFKNKERTRGKWRFIPIYVDRGSFAPLLTTRGLLETVAFFYFVSGL